MLLNLPQRQQPYTLISWSSSWSLFLPCISCYYSWTETCRWNMKNKKWIRIQYKWQRLGIYNWITSEEVTGAVRRRRNALDTRTSALKVFFCQKQKSRKETSWRETNTGREVTNVSTIFRKAFVFSNNKTGRRKMSMRRKQRERETRVTEVRTTKGRRATGSENESLPGKQLQSQ